jgi:hypothetical protein
MAQPFEVITDPDVEARRKARAEEYGTWECGPAPIEFGGARAFNEGEPVPKSTVERLQLDKLGIVVPTGTFAKKSADTQAEAQRLTDEALLADVQAQAVNTETTKGGNG